MISTTHPTLNEALKVICKEQPRQFAVAEKERKPLTPQTKLLELHQTKTKLEEL